MSILKLFEYMRKYGASDLHLAEGSPPLVRVHGSLARIGGEEKLDRGMLIRYLREICPDERWQRFAQLGDLDFAYSVGEEVMRLRCNYFLKEVGIGAVFRTIPSVIKSLEELAAPEVLWTLAELRRGLVLVTGPTGSGKSTTLAAMINHINANFSRRILTVEEPVEFVHKGKRSVMIQREVGVDTVSFKAALRLAARMDFDVLLVGEMRDHETISAAVNAAELGVLVYGTLHTNSAVKAIDRIIDSFPAKQQPQIRAQLAENLKGVCAQTLLKHADGKGRLAAHEIMIQTAAVQTAIRECKTQGLVSAIQSGRQLGMRLMDDVIEEYLKGGYITKEEALEKCLDKKRFGATD
ncbi:type IV pilus twitching motility protein PilT [Planctomycetota bacterium]